MVTAEHYPELLLEAVRSVTQQHRVPQRVVIVTTAGTVDPALLAESTRELTDADIDWHHLERPKTAGDSFAEALLPLLGEDPSWLWFMHDDAEAEPTALSALLREAEVSPSVALAGAKQVELDRPRHLLDVGITVTHTGEPVSMIEPGELDQGQYDDRSDVFAVSAPGLLIRHDVWQHLDGVDPTTPEVAGVVDLCLRARLAGHRVVVVPQAVVRHEGGAEGLYATRSQRTEAAAWMRLKHHRSLLTMPLLWLWLLVTAVGSFLWSLLIKEPGAGASRAAGTVRGMTRPIALLRSRRRARRTRRSSDAGARELRPRRSQVRAYRRSVLDISEPDEVIGDGTGTTALDSQPTGDNDDFTALATPERNWVGIGLVTALVVLGLASVLGLRTLLGAEAVGGGGLLPATAKFSDLWHSAISGWAAAGAGMVAQPGPAGWLFVLLGLTGSASVAMVVLWCVAIPLAAAGAWTVAGAVARSRLARFVISLAWGLAPTLLISLGEGRWGAVVVHLVLPWLVLAIIRATGSAAPRRRDPSSLIIDRHIRPGTHGVISWTASGWTALLLAVVTAAAPSLLIPAVLTVLVLAGIARGRGRALWWTPALALALFVPALITHWTHPRALLADPGVPLSFTPAAGWQMLLGFPTEFTADAGLLAVPGLESLLPGFPWALIAVLAISVPMLLLAIFGTLSLRTAGTKARIGVILAIIGVITAWVASQITVSIDSAGQPVSLYTGPAVSVLWLGVLLAAVAGFDLVYRIKRVAVPAAAALVLVSVTVSGTLWLVPRFVPLDELQNRGQEALQARATTGESDPELSALAAVNRVYPTEQRLIPALAADQGSGPLATRTLVLERTSEGVRSSVVSGNGPALNRMSSPVVARQLTGSLFAAENAEPDPADEALRSLSAELVAGTTTDPRETLQDFGAAFVVLRDPDGTDETTAANLDAVPGLTPVGLTSHGWLWRVAPANDDGVAVLGEESLQDPAGFSVARASIRDADGEAAALLALSEDTVTAEVPAAGDEAQRTVQLAERADEGWHATFNGEALESVSGGDAGGAENMENSEDWNQSFALPDGSGELEIWYEPASPVWVWIAPGALLIISALLAIPSPARRTASRTRDRHETPALEMALLDNETYDAPDTAEPAEGRDQP